MKLNDDIVQLKNNIQEGSENLDKVKNDFREVKVKRTQTFLEFFDKVAE